uniref:Uncharacterized protein n=1 Tax=Cucumis melo TaxID=3656 RepID=A0A9I9E8M6_CUCME
MLKAETEEVEKKKKNRRNMVKERTEEEGLGMEGKEFIGRKSKEVSVGSEFLKITNTNSKGVVVWKKFFFFLV